MTGTFIHGANSGSIRTPSTNDIIYIFKKRAENLNLPDVEENSTCVVMLLNISYKDQLTNEEVRRKIQAAIGEYNKLLTLVKKR